VWEDFKTSNHRLFVVGIVILLLLTGICGWWYYYTNSRTKADYHDVNRAVERIEDRIQRTEKRLSDGTAEIETLEGVQKARKDDFIIKGIRGEIYPCRRDIFEETYEEFKEDI